MSCAVGVIDGKPLFIATIGWCDIRPRLAAVERSPQVVKKILEKAKIKKTAGVIRVENRITTKNVRLKNAGVNPRRAAIGCMTRNPPGESLTPRYQIVSSRCSFCFRSSDRRKWSGSFAASPTMLLPFAFTFT